MRQDHHSYGTLMFLSSVTVNALVNAFENFEISDRLNFVSHNVAVSINNTFSLFYNFIPGDVTKNSLFLNIAQQNNSVNVLEALSSANYKENQFFYFGDKGYLESFPFRYGTQNVSSKITHEFVFFATPNASFVLNSIVSKNDVTTLFKSINMNIGK